MTYKCRHSCDDSHIGHNDLLPIDLCVNNGGEWTDNRPGSGSTCAMHLPAVLA